MDCHDYITVAPERKRGQHLGQEERGAIQQLKKQGHHLAKVTEDVRLNAAPSEDGQYTQPIQCAAEDIIVLFAALPLFNGW